MDGEGQRSTAFQLGLDHAPSYRCHKVVRALKIAAVVDQPIEEGKLASKLVEFVDQLFAPLLIHASCKFFAQVQAGGYIVQYLDGYVSFSPATAFEGGYMAVSMQPVNADLENRFKYHPPKPGQPERYEAIREAAKQFAYLISHTVPASREQSTALTHLDAAVMFANAGIARNE